jgi:hypothetical protein
VVNLTHTCVRKNYVFELDVECPVDSIVKPMSNTFICEEQEDKPAKAIQKPIKLRSDRLSHRSNVMKVQHMLGRMDEEDGEDEAIYSLAMGSLDVGALVAFGSLHEKIWNRPYGNFHLRI